MTKTEKFLVWGIVAVVGLELLRTFTWKPTGTATKPFRPIGMNDYASVARRA